jgi:retron-type reverse transcriptase
MKRQLGHNFSDIISLDNLFTAWHEFAIGKSKRKDVQQFSRNLVDNIVSLHIDLVNRTYTHGGYIHFSITDPKPRNIHKATVRDRILHHAIYRLLYPFFDKRFIADSYSCRNNKGTHRAINKFRSFASIVTKNHTKTAWVLKCDIRKFFASIDHTILMTILSFYISDRNIIWLLERVISSFNSTTPGVGLPLGNLTSQLFCNVYMNEFDQFVKHTLKCKYYIRYADDFVFLADSKQVLESYSTKISGFLNNSLKLSLHPNKIFTKTIASGVDFLGWVQFPNHRTLRTTTKLRMFRRVQESPKPATMASYSGMISHGNTFHLREKLLNEYWLNQARGDQ